jgi:hypothetical protein
MICDVKTPLSQVAEAITKGRIEDIASGKADTQQEILNRFQLFQNSFEVRWKDESLLRDKKIPTINGKVRVYGVKNQEADIEKSFTLEGKVNFENKIGKERAKQISEAEESILKKDTGTAVHSVMEQLTKYFIANEFKDKVLTTDTGSALSLADIKKIVKLSDRNFKVLYDTAKQFITDAIETQNKIDPSQKPIVVAEQIVGTNELMGTADLITVYSDKTAEHFDYKTIVPKKGYTEFDKASKRVKVNTMSWIPFYKYTDWNLQLPKTTASLLKTMGVTEVRKSRVIPIQVNLKWDSVNNKMTDEISQIETFVTSKDFLDPIAIQEKASTSTLELQLQKLNRIKLSLVKDLEAIRGTSPKKEAIKEHINRLTISINKLQVKEDNTLLINDYERLVKRYGELTDGKFRKLSDITDESSEDKFLDKEEHRQLILELEAFSGVLAATQDYYFRLGLPEEEVNKWDDKRVKLQANVESMIVSLKDSLLSRQSFNVTNIDEIENASDVSFLNKLFDTFSEINHPIFKEAYFLISKYQNEKRLALQQFKNKLNDVAKELEDYSKSSGMGLFGAYNKLINRSTGNLHGKYTKEFYEGLKKNQENSNKVELQKTFELKEDAQEKYDQYLKRVVDRSGWDLTNEEDKKKYDTFKSNNSLESFLFSSRDIWKYYKIKPSVENSLYSEEYKTIKNTPALNNYYNFWNETMSEFRSKMGFNSYSDLPANFIPNFRAEMVETLFRDNTLNLWENITDMFKVRQDDFDLGTESYTGKLDIVTGEVLPEIPKWGLNGIYNKDGVLDNNLKSYDLTKVLYTFAEVALNYESMAKIQTEIDILGDLIGTNGVKQTNSDGKVLTTLSGAYAKITGEQLDVVRLFKQHILASFYGITNQDKNKDVAKALLSFNKALVITKLALNPVTQVAASASAKINQYYEGVKGYYYDRSNMKDSEKALVGILSGKNEIDKMALGYFEFSDKGTNIMATELPSNNILNLSQRGLSMIGFRKGSEYIDNSIGLAMMRNYGIDENGNVKRVKNLKDKRTLSERSKVVDGKFEIEGLTLDGYTQFRNMVRQVSRGIKGELSDGDMRSIQMSTLGKLFMTFKTWLPDLVKERFGGIKYQSTTDAIVIGKMNAIWKSNLKPEQKNFLGIVAETSLNIGKLILDILTFGYGKMFKVNQSRARALLNKLKEDNPNNEQIQNFTEEDFMDYMNGQIRSSVTELRVYLAFLTLLMALGGDWDDDGEKDYKNNLVTRATYRTLNRVRRELGFFYGSEGVSIITKNSVPVTDLLVTSLDLVENTFDESRDAFFGENNNRDKANVGHYFLKVFPGGRPITDLFVLDETAEKKEL